MNEDLTAYIEPVMEVAQRAAQEILLHYAKTELNVKQKDDRTPLTDADLAAHRAIEAGLAELTADIPFLSEESTSIPFSTRRTWKRYWLVDPLDGTREFLKRNDEFTVNIALVDGHQPVLGLIYVPVTRLCYYATKGNGAFKRAPDGEITQIHTRRSDQNNLVIAGSRSHAGARLNDFLNQLDHYELISMGSSLKSCLVAEGKADLYPRLGPTSEWDTAAAQCIVEEAGGVIVRTDFEPLRYNTKSELLNPHFLVIGDREFSWENYFSRS